MPFVLCSNGQDCFDCIHACDRCKIFIEVYARMLCEPSCDHSCFKLMHVPISVLLCLINPFDTDYIFVFWYINQFHVWFFLMNSIYSSMACAHTSYSIASSNVSGSYVRENNKEREWIWCTSFIYLTQTSCLHRFCRCRP